MSNIIGIDVSKASLDCAYLRDADQTRTKRLRCNNVVSCFAPYPGVGAKTAWIMIVLLAFDRLWDGIFGFDLPSYISGVIGGLAAVPLWASGIC